MTIFNSCTSIASAIHTPAHAPQYKQLSLTVDLLILSVSEEDTGNYRKQNKKK